MGNEAVITGQIRGWNQGNGQMSIRFAGSENIPVGTVDPSGNFRAELPGSDRLASYRRGESPGTCQESGRYVTYKCDFTQQTTAGSLLAQFFAGTGGTYQRTSEPPPGALESTIVYYIFHDKDDSAVGRITTTTVSDGSTSTTDYDIRAKAGWNRVIVESTAPGSFIFRTGSAPQETIWVWPVK